METHCHHSVGVVKRFLYSVAVMHVDIEVQDSRVHSKQLQYAYDNIVDVAKSTGFGLFGMMVASRPVDYNITEACNDSVSRINTATDC